MAQAFDLYKVPSEQLVAFYGLNFAAAASDGEVDKDELMAIFETLDLSSLSSDEKEKVRGFVVKPPDVGEALDSIAMGSDELKYMVVVSVTEVLLADDVITDEEQVFYDEVCRRLRVTYAQRDAIINFVKEARRIRLNGVDDNNAEKAMKNAASGLAAVGVPVAAVYFSGSVLGLSAAGITSGLAALGLGLGMVPGIGIAVLLGVGVYVGIRTLLGDDKKKKEATLAAERERKAQLVIKNLQDVINVLLTRIENLESKAADIEANKAAIRVLRERLTNLQRILAQRQQRLANT